MPPPGPASRRGGMTVVVLLCLVALGGYALFLLSDRAEPVPGYPPASFGMSVAGTTDPAAFRVVDEVSLTVEDLDAADASAKLEVTFRAGDDPSRPVAGEVFFALPVEAEVDSVRMLTLPAGMERVVGADQEIAEAAVDRELLHRVPDRPTPVGTLNGRPLTAWIDGTAAPAGAPETGVPEAGAAEAGAPPARLLQVPVAADAGTVTVALDLTVPSNLFARPGRAGETAFAVDFGTTAAASRAVPGARPLAEYADPLEPATLELTLGYLVELTEMEVDAVPQVTRTGYEKVIWAEEVTEDSRLRVDGVLVDVPARYWLGLLDNAALLLLGAMVAVVVNRLLVR